MRNLTSWFLYESQGVNIFDNTILLFLKVVYLGRRVLLRLILGKKERDRLGVLSVQVVDIVMFLQAEARGCENAKVVTPGINASKGRCFGH